MIRIFCESQFRLIGGLRRASWLAALSLLTALTGCAGKTLTQVKTETVLPPALSCAPRPAVPNADALAGPNGDAILGAYIARLEAWGSDCEGAVADLNAWRAAHVKPAQ